MINIEVFCDGGARGNPGPAGIGIIIKIDSQIIGKSDNRQKESRNQIEISKYIGIKTNNQAEYLAVIEALKWLHANRRDPGEDIQIDFFLDSQLVVEQLNGNYRIKNEGLKPLFLQIQTLVNKLNVKISFAHVRREKNILADKLVNQVLDNETKRLKDKEN